jgi:nitroreductase
MADFRELLETRRSVRDYEDREVPFDLVNELLKDACEAPSGGNRQPWAFSVIRDRGVMKRLSDESKRNLLEDEKSIKSSVVRLYRPILKDENYNVFYNAPCLIYITGPKALHSAPADCSLAACYLMFSAADRGLGTCWINLGSYLKAPETLSMLGIPDDHLILATVIVGYPKEIPGKPPRNEPKVLAVVG